MNKPCVFFDRDGIVNRYPGVGRYVERLEDFHLLPEFFQALRIVLDRGYEAVIVTNQRGVALGKTSEESLEEIHDRLLAAVREQGLRLADIMVCTDNDDNSFHRKPNPGMLLDAAKRHGLDIERSWMIGDSERDVVAGQRAGCVHAVLVDPACPQSQANECVAGMPELVALLDRDLPPA